MTDSQKAALPNKVSRVGIREVARKAGVSVATVSRTLANTGYPVAEATRKRVIEAAEDLNFVPNDLARGLSGSRSNTIGVIVPNLVNLYYARVLVGIEQVAASAGLSIIFSNTNHSIEKRERDIALLLRKRVDGIIICGGGSDYESVSGALGEGGVPVVVLGRHEHLDYPAVHADNIKAGYLATKHLVDLGHKAIGFLAGPREWPDGNDRIEGFKRGIAEAKLDSSRCPISHGDFEEQDAYDRTTAMGRGGMPVTALVAGNDRIALGGMAAAIDLGLRIPQDLAFIGFDNIATAQYVRPSLTTMSMPAKEIGAEGMRLILRILAGESIPARTVFEAKLLERQSSGAARAVPAETA